MNWLTKSPWSQEQSTMTALMVRFSVTVSKPYLLLLWSQDGDKATHCRPVLTQLGGLQQLTSRGPISLRHNGKISPSVGPRRKVTLEWPVSCLRFISAFSACKALRIYSDQPLTGMPSASATLSKKWTPSLGFSFPFLYLILIVFIEKHYKDPRCVLTIEWVVNSAALGLILSTKIEKLS